MADRKNNGAPDTGLLQGAYPYVRFGEGPDQVVIIPGLNDALDDVRSLGRFWPWVYEQITPGRRLCVVSRKRGLPRGASTRDLAAEYAALIRSEFGRAHVIGMSMGSKIAQWLAIDHSKEVDRLVLGLAGGRLHASAADIIRSWIELAEAEQWRDLQTDMMNKTYAPGTRPKFQFAKWDDAQWQDSPEIAGDFIVSAEALLTHDALADVPSIQAPTLVMGGSADQLAGSQALAELAGAIPGAHMEIIDGAGHGLAQERKDEFDRILTDFFD